LHVSKLFDRISEPETLFFMIRILSDCFEMVEDKSKKKENKHE